jgi:hypothetical protein
LGRHDPSAQLAEPFASRERAVRERLPLEALLLHAAPASSGSQHRAA